MTQLRPTRVLVALLAGGLLGIAGLDVLGLSARSGLVRTLAVIALVLILFRDGLEVDGELLRREWHLPARKLAVGMPITAGVVALAAHVLTSLTWTESLLLGAMFSATDPVLSSGVVTNPRVPALIRHSLNLESGLNDGLALPPVLALSTSLSASHGHFVWWHFVLQDVGLGIVFGVVCGLVAARLAPRGRGQLVFGLAAAAATYVIAAIVPPHGNGLIAVFVCAITAGVRRPGLQEGFTSAGEPVVEVAKVGIFFVLGAVVTVGGLFSDGWSAVAVVAATFLIARPLAVTIALLGTGTSRAGVAFMAWFGPKGVATMTFALLVLQKHLTHGQELFDLAALCVVASVVIHGLTDAPGVDWIARREGEEVDGHRR